MIKKLQRKFISVAIISVFLVLLVIMSTINITSYVNINKKADNILNILTNNGGTFPKPEKSQYFDHKPTFSEMSPEAPYETRYFSVYFNSDGNITKSDTGFIAAVTDEAAHNFAIQAYESEKVSGFCNDYKYLCADYNDGKIVVFLDCSRDLSTFRSFLFTSILVSTAGIVGVFILVLLLSKIIIRPLAESYEKQKRFITDASHEIKTPLTIIDANTEVLEMESGENEWTKSIKNQINRLSSLTTNLVSLSRMDEENNKLQMTDFSLSDAVLEVCDSFVPLAQTCTKTLNTNIEKNLTVNGNEQSIRQLISILLDNSIKYANQNGVIAVSLKKAGKKNVLSVYNTVLNIEKGYHDILFDRFYRADSSRNSQTGGYGIGLSLAKSIVEAHRGKIISRSNDEHSIEFIVSI